MEQPNAQERTGLILGLVGAILGWIGLMLPWIDAVILIPISRTGLQLGGDAYIIAVLALVGLIAAVIGLSSGKRLGWLLVLAGIAMIVVVVIDYTALAERITSFSSEFALARVGPGIFVCGVGGLLMVIGGGVALSVKREAGPHQASLLLKITGVIALIVVAVVVVGLLFVSFVPFPGASVSSKQTEARELLKQIFVMERAYYQERDAYYDFRSVRPGGTIPDLGIEIMYDARYTYSIDVYDGGFTASAQANLDGDAKMDRWQIDSDGNLVCTSDDSED
jgi:hypothetical protein